MCNIQDDPYPVQISVLNEQGAEEQKTIYYKIRSVHRRWGNPEKCIWTVSPTEEFNCFTSSAFNNWLELENTKGWGVKINQEGGLDQVGISDQNEELKIAKFRDSSSTGEWHGYPADYCRRKQDKPSIRVLKDWKERGLISKTNMDKIKQCKKCCL